MTTSTDTINAVMSAARRLDLMQAARRSEQRQQVAGTLYEEHFIEELKQEAEAAILQGLPFITGGRREGHRTVAYLEPLEHAIRATLDEDNVLDAVVALVMKACKTDDPLRSLICEEIGKDNALWVMEARGLLGSDE